MAKRLIYISIIFAVLTVAAFSGWHALSSHGKVMGSHTAVQRVSAVNASAGEQAGPASQQAAQSQAAFGAKSGRQPLAIPR